MNADDRSNLGVCRTDHRTARVRDVDLLALGVRRRPRRKRYLLNCSGHVLNAH